MHVFHMLHPFPPPPMVKVYYYLSVACRQKKTKVCHFGTRFWMEGSLAQTLFFILSKDQYEAFAMKGT
jgi:hypothetical protein